jgi:hypothetical protein
MCCFAQVWILLLPPSGRSKHPKSNGEESLSSLRTSLYSSAFR